MATNNVLINNLCDWPLYMSRRTGVAVGGGASITIPASAKNFPLLTFDEVQAQIQWGNKMFTGTDGQGSHARIQIVSEEQRKKLFQLDGLEDVTPPNLLTADAVKALLAIRGKAKFNERLAELVQTDAEKKMLVELANSVGAEDAEAWKVDALRKLAETAGL